MLATVESAAAPADDMDADERPAELEGAADITALRHVRTSAEKRAAEEIAIPHKIGVTGGNVKIRVANAKHDAAYLLADVEIVATCDLYNINRARLENLIHRIFDPARLDIAIKDRFGQPVIPREWFLVPLFIVDQAVERIKDGTITDHVYDPKSAALVPAAMLQQR